MRAHEVITEDQKRRPEISLRHLNDLKHINRARAASFARQAALKRTMRAYPVNAPRRFADGVLAHVRTPGGPTGAAQPHVRLARSPQTLCLRRSLTRSNRRGT